MRDPLTRFISLKKRKSISGKNKTGRAFPRTWLQGWCRRSGPVGNRRSRRRPPPQRKAGTPTDHTQPQSKSIRRSIQVPTRSIARGSRKGDERERGQKLLTSGRSHLLRVDEAMEWKHRRRRRGARGRTGGVAAETSKAGRREGVEESRRETSGASRQKKKKKQWKRRGVIGKWLS